MAEDQADDGAPLTWQDKVKIARTRTQINGLHTAVKDREHVVARRRFVTVFITCCCTLLCYII